MPPANPIDAEVFHGIFIAAERSVKFALATCRTIPGRDQDELAEIEAEIGNLDAEATDRDLAFWQSNQAEELFAALERLHERIRHEAHRSGILAGRQIAVLAPDQPLCRQPGVDAVDNPGRSGHNRTSVNR